MKRKVITITSKDLKIELPKKEKTISEDIMERYLRRSHQRVSETDKKVVRYLQKIKGSTIQNTAVDLRINYKTTTDVYRRLEMGGIVKFIIKLLPTRDGRKKVNTKLWILTPKFIKLTI